MVPTISLIQIVDSPLSDGSFHSTLYDIDWKLCSGMHGSRWPLEATKMASSPIAVDLLGGFKLC